MSTLTAYALAEGFNNTAGYVLARTFLVAHVTSFGSFEWGIERTPLEGPIRDMGDGRFNWLLKAGLLPSEAAYLMTTFLNGERSGEVTASTKLNDATWVDVNCILTLPRTFTPLGERYGDAILTYSQAEVIS